MFMKGGPMGERLIYLTTRRAWPVLASSLLVLVAAVVVGAGAVGKLKGGGFDDPASESSRARVALGETLHQPRANLLLLVTAPEGSSVDAPQVAAAGRDAARRLDAQPGVSILGDYWSAPEAAAAGLRSTDARKALVIAHVDGDEDAVLERTEELGPLLTTTVDGVRIETGGFGQANADVTGQVTKDLARAESLAIPLTLTLLVVVFASVVAGLLPLLVGGIAIAGTFAALSVIAEVTDVSIFALNLTTALGLGLGIDYALLIVSRFREELERGRDVEDAVAVTLRTAGRTVLFSAATIAVALSALLVFPLFFLRSFAYAGIAVVAVTAVAAVVTMPALLRVLGPRVNLLRVGPRRSALPSSTGFWSRLAAVVMRRPVLTALPVVALLVTMAVPFSGVEFGVPDDRAVPAADSQGRRVGDVLRADFASRDNEALTVVLPRVEGGPAAVGAYAARVSGLAGVARVDASTGTYVEGRRVAPGRPDLAVGEAAGVRVIPSVEAYSDAAQDLVGAVRGVAAPGERLVGGPSAELVDAKAAIAERLPLAAGLIALTTFLLLFLFTGSVLLPIKALVLNAATIVAVVGAMVWVFQEGHLADLLGFTPLPLTVTMPLLMFCVAFGLSMDYEVFLLGRIKEQYDEGADTTTAVAVGLERTGRIVTTAAALLAITFFAMVSSKVSFIQMFGLGTGLAVVLDATLVRGVLVPSLMRVMGRANWWAPRPLRRLHGRIGLSERESGLPEHESGTPELLSPRGAHRVLQPAARGADNLSGPRSHP
jgi:RND superfamily putative drug exporter